MCIDKRESLRTAIRLKIILKFFSLILINLLNTITEISLFKNKRSNINTTILAAITEQKSNERYIDYLYEDFDWLYSFGLIIPLKWFGYLLWNWLRTVDTNSLPFLSHFTILIMSQFKKSNLFLQPNLFWREKKNTKRFFLFKCSSTWRAKFSPCVDTHCTTVSTSWIR